MYRTILSTAMFLLLAATAQAQQCLHSDTTNPDQLQRRTDAVNAMRALNTAEVTNRATANKYVDFATLAASQAWVRANRSGKFSSVAGAELLPGFELHLTTDGNKYSIALKDKTDPCGYTLYTNDAGIIYTAYPIR